MRCPWLQTLNSPGRAPGEELGDVSSGCHPTCRGGGSHHAKRRASLGLHSCEYPHFAGSCGKSLSYLSFTVAVSRCYCLRPLHTSVSVCLAPSPQIPAESLALASQVFLSRKGQFLPHGPQQCEGRQLGSEEVICWAIPTPSPGEVQPAAAAALRMASPGACTNSFCHTKRSAQPTSPCMSDMFWTGRFPHQTTRAVFPGVRCHAGSLLCIQPSLRAPAALSAVLACDKLLFFHLIPRNANDCQNPSAPRFLGG